MKFALFANTDWYLYNFRLSTALELGAHGHEVIMLSPPGEFGERFATHGLRWITVPMDRASLNPLREVVVVRELKRVLKAERPDLLHNFTVKCAVYGALAAHSSGVRAVVNAVAGMGYVFANNGIKARMLRPAVRALMRGTLARGNSRLILQNPDDAETFTRLRIMPPQRISLIRSSGVNLARFQPCAEREANARLRVLLAARLVREKGVGDYVEAARILKRSGRDIEFLLAGLPDPGNPGSITREEVERWSREGWVNWLGHVEDMAALLRSIDVMVLPSYYREGVPKSLIEAAACGLAIVTTNLPGCREVVTEHGVDGLHVDPRNAGSLAAQLAALDNDRGLLRRLGERARHNAVTYFDERMVIRRTLEVYSELLQMNVAVKPVVEIDVPAGRTEASLRRTA